ncbi:MAG: hypothetical protein Q8M94_10425 [Ignavibacteria bacterium]|nr:hypothetical protein [Ignavibacteria bacterium]
MKHLAFLFLAVILAACSTFEDDEIIYTIPVEAISVKNSSNLTIEFIASNSCGSMCWERTYFERTINGKNIFIKLFAVADGSTACPDVCVNVEVPISINLPSSDSFTFHFWKSDTSSIDTTLIVGL